MYKIIKDGTTIGLTEFLTYIKQHDNGCFVLCPEPEASGIAFDGKVYHLLGREALEGVSTLCWRKLMRVVRSPKLRKRMVLCL